MVKVILLLANIITQSLAGFDSFPQYHARPQRPDYYHPGPPLPPRDGYGNRPPHHPSVSGEQPLIFEEESDNSQQSNQPPFRGSPMEVLYSWKQVDFEWPNDQARENAIRNQQYIPRNTLILDVDVYEGRSGRMLFVTLPRVRPGIPATIATVSSRRSRGANLLTPFPDWASNTNGDCENSITSVFRTHVDPCGRLWVLDSGNNNVFNGAGSRIVCPPQVLIYDLNNNKRLIGKYRIPSSMIADNTLLVTIAVDTRRRDCSDAFAYIADSIAYKMIVFNFQNQKFWRINSILFFPYPDLSRFNINGVSFDLMGGVFGLALGPLYRGNRRLYFHCIDSIKQSWVETANLRNHSVWQENMNAAPRAFNLFNGTRSSQSAAATMNPEGIMFFGLLGSNEIACWNSRSKFSRKNIHVLAKDERNLQFNSGIKVYGDKLYAATSRLQNYITNRIPENEENYRVLVGDVRRLTRGTQCQVDPLGNRIDSDYEPDSESVDFLATNEFPPQP